MEDEEYPEYLKKQSYEDLLLISYSIDQAKQAKRYAMVVAEIARRDESGEGKNSPNDRFGTMRNPHSEFRQGIVAIVMGVIFYLVDCLATHPRHPEVSWIESGIYSGGPFGVLASAVFVLLGVYKLLKSAH